MHDLYWLATSQIAGVHGVSIMHQMHCAYQATLQCRNGTNIPWGLSDLHAQIVCRRSAVK